MNKKASFFDKLSQLKKCNLYRLFSDMVKDCAFHIIVEGVLSVFCIGIIVTHWAGIKMANPIEFLFAIQLAMVLTILVSGLGILVIAWFFLNQLYKYSLRKDKDQANKEYLKMYRQKIGVFSLLGVLLYGLIGFLSTLYLQPRGFLAEYDLGLKLITAISLAFGLLWNSASLFRLKRANFPHYIATTTKFIDEQRNLNYCLAEYIAAFLTLLITIGSTLFLIIEVAATITKGDMSNVVVGFYCLIIYTVVVFYVQYLTKKKKVEKGEHLSQLFPHPDFLFSPVKEKDN